MDYCGYINFSLSAKQTNVGAIANTQKRQRANNAKCDGYSMRNSRISNISNQFKTFRVGVFWEMLMYLIISALFGWHPGNWLNMDMKNINEPAVLVVWFLRRGSAKLQNFKEKNGFDKAANSKYSCCWSKGSSWFQAAISLTTQAAGQKAAMYSKQRSLQLLMLLVKRQQLIPRSHL